MFGKRFDFLSLAGIKIGIDVSWFFVAVLLAWTLAVGYFPLTYPDLSPTMYWFMGITGMLGLFVCVVLHELGHALVAKHYKLPITHITLFIFGGVAEIKKEPTSPKVEFQMAIAGPCVSVVLILCMYGLTQLGEMWNWSILIRGVTHYLTFINAAIVVFNLIPAFPLDGGRIFRAILWGWKKNLAWATRLSTRIGSGFGIFLILFGVFSFFVGSLISGLWLVVLGLFLQRAAASSRTQFYVSRELEGEKVIKFMKKDPISVSPDVTIKEFIEEHVYASHHHLYPVTRKGDLMGYISLRQVKVIPSGKWSKTLVEDAMVPRSAFPTVTPRTSALEALNLIHQIDPPTLLVVEGQRLVGILTAQDLFKLISLKLELEESLHS